MYIKIVDDQYKSKYGDVFEIGKEYTCISKNSPFNFSNEETIGGIYAEIYAPADPRKDIKFLEIEPITNSKDYYFNRLCSEKIKIIREISYEEIIKIDVTGRIKNVVKLL